MNIYDFKVQARDGSQISLNEYKGKVLLVVNTATACGFTPQYSDLQKIYVKVIIRTGWKFQIFLAINSQIRLPVRMKKFTLSAQVGLELAFLSFLKLM